MTRRRRAAGEKRAGRTAVTKDLKQAVSAAPDGRARHELLPRSGRRERGLRQKARGVLELPDARARDARRRRADGREAAHGRDVLDRRHARRAHAEQRLDRREVLLGREAAKLEGSRRRERWPTVGSWREEFWAGCRFRVVPAALVVLAALVDRSSRRFRWDRRSCRCTKRPPR